MNQRTFYKVTYYKLYGLIIYTDKIVQQSVAGFFNSGWHDCSTVTGTIVQQLLARLFNSGWHDSSPVTGTIVQQWLARLFNSHWHNSSTVTGLIVQQWLARFFNSHGQGFFFFLCWQNPSTVKITFEESCHVPGIRHVTRLIDFNMYNCQMLSLAISPEVMSMVEASTTE